MTNASTSATLAMATEAVEFVLDEARLLNDCRYEDWLALFAADGHYWVPLDCDAQADPVTQASLTYDDTLMLATRVRRLRGQRAHSLEPGVRSLHLLQQPRLDTSEDGTDLRVYTPFIYTEVLGQRQTMLTGVWRHRLRSTSSGLRIVLKRVDLVTASAPHEAIHLFP